MASLTGRQCGAERTEVGAAPGVLLVALIFLGYLMFLVSGILAQVKHWASLIISVLHDIVSLVMLHNIPVLQLRLMLNSEHLNISIPGIQLVVIYLKEKHVG